MRQYSHQTAIADGTGEIVTGVGAHEGNMYYWNSGLSGSALIEIIHNPDPAGMGPWILAQTITALHLASGMVVLPLPIGYIATRATIYSGGGNTGRVSTFFELR